MNFNVLFVLERLERFIMWCILVDSRNKCGGKFTNGCKWTILFLKILVVISTDLEIWWKGKKCFKVRHFIWFASTWCLWRLRNNIMFRDVVPNLLVMVDQIMYFSWFWFLCRIKTDIPYGYVDWCNNHLACLLSI
jgi:hypothetical protein